MHAPISVSALYAHLSFEISNRVISDRSMNITRNSRIMVMLGRTLFIIAPIFSRVTSSNQKTYISWYLLWYSYRLLFLLSQIKFITNADIFDINIFIPLFHLYNLIHVIKRVGLFERWLYVIFRWLSTTTMRTDQRDGDTNNRSTTR